MSCPKHNLVLWLNQAERQLQDVAGTIIPLKAESWAALQQCRTEKEFINLIGAARYNRLKYSVPTSNKILKLEERAAKHEARIARTRKAADDKLTSRIVREYGFIAIEHGLQGQKLRGKAKAKKREDGKGYAQTGAKRKSGVSKSLSDASIGRKTAMLERKAKRSNRTFAKIESAYTSQSCPVCGHLHKAPMDGDRVYHCECCGWHCDRDQSAGINIELMAYAANSTAKLSSAAELARVYGCFWMQDNPKETKPLWAKKLSKKKLAEWMKNIRASYPDKVLQNFELEYRKMKAQK